MKDKNENTERKINQHNGSWIAIGIGIGAALGTAMGNLAVGIAIGAAIGIAIMAEQRRKQE